jgi:hypothetical protein
MLEVHQASIRRFFKSDRDDRYLGKSKRGQLMKLLRLNPQRFAKDVNAVRRQHLAEREEAGR